jgi:phosphotransferase system enzyme I (PtsI)
MYTRLDGIAAAPGVGIGRAFIFNKEMPHISLRKIPASQVEGEVERFRNTLRQAGDEIRRTRRMVEMEHGTELAQIFDAQLLMLQDSQVLQQTISSIRDHRYSAQRAFSQSLELMKNTFEGIENEYLRARLSDVLDIESQVLIRLGGGELQALRAVRANTVVVIHELLPSESVQLTGRLVKGLVTEVGGATSHASIITRSMLLPTVVGTKNGCSAIKSGDLLIVDGTQGVVHVNPEAEIVRYYRGELRRQLRRERDLSSRRTLPSVTRDEREIVLMANIDVPSEIQLAIDNGAQGVGMYRTEFLYQGYRLPTEEEQLEAYSEIVEALAPNPVIIRTIDLGGDKLAHALDVVPEANPFLGWRGIRICLDTPELFSCQLRALLRAGVHGDVQILFPMISGFEELQRARAALEAVKYELRTEGLPFQEDVKVGMMIEVPSVALMSDRFAREVDFFSLGTNDLTQYTLAVDRGTARVADLYDPFHPAVLKLMKMVADTGAQHETPVSICGELAGDPLAVLLLVGLGLEILSLSPGLIPEVKEVIRAGSRKEAQQIAVDCLEMESGKKVRRYLEERMAKYLDHVPFYRLPDSGSELN